MKQQQEPTLRQVGTNNIRYKTRTYTLDKQRAKDDFQTLTNRRDIRPAQVNKIRRALQKGINFDAPLICNLRNGTYRLIDGNHRIEALRLFFEQYPGRKVEVTICYYEQLSNTEEKETYTKWSLGMRQSVNDYIKQHWDDIPITRHLKPPHFPCKISYKWTKTAMELKQLFLPWLSRNRQGVQTPTGGANTFVEQMKNVNTTAFEIVRAFMCEYIQLFGEPDKANIMYKKTVFSSLMKIWLDNYQRINLDEIMKRFGRLRGCERVQYWSQQSPNRDNIEQARKDFRLLLNKGKWALANTFV